MTIPSQPALSAWLRTQLPPALAKFTDLARRYLKLEAPDRASFLRTLAGLETEVSPGGGLGILNWGRPQKRDYRKLAETLLLFEDLLDKADGLRRAYQHYLINTDGPIPLNEGEDDFDVFAWAREYAAGLSIRIEIETETVQSPTLTLKMIDDPERRIPFLQSDKSRAWSLRQVGQKINLFRYGRLDVIPASLFRLEPKARRYSKVNALWLADLSELVYHREGYVRAELRRYGFESFTWIESPATGIAGPSTQAFVAAKADCGIVGFRGTREFQDYLTDFRLDGKPLGAAGTVHRGVAEALESVWDLLLEKVIALGPERPIFVTGHSLGAALAQLAALRLTRAGVRVAAVYGFGSPRLGDKAFGVAYDRALKDRSFLHVNHLDIITTVPFWKGFHPAIQPVRRFNERHRLSEAQLELEQPPSDDNTKEQRLEEVKQVLHDSQTYLDITDLSDSGLTYEAEFNNGRINDHKIAQYLFKLACSIVDDRMAARRRPHRPSRA